MKILDKEHVEVPFSHGGKNYKAVFWLPSATEWWIDEITQQIGKSVLTVAPGTAEYREVDVGAWNAIPSDAYTRAQRFRVKKPAKKKTIKLGKTEPKWIGNKAKLPGGTELRIEKIPGGSKYRYKVVRGASIMSSGDSPSRDSARREAAWAAFQMGYPGTGHGGSYVDPDTCALKATMKKTSTKNTLHVEKKRRGEWAWSVHVGGKKIASGTEPRQLAAENAARTAAAKKAPGVIFTWNPHPPKGKAGRPLTAADMRPGKVTIRSRENPEWGTWGIRGRVKGVPGAWEIVGDRGSRVLNEGEFRFWEVASSPPPRATTSGTTYLSFDDRGDFEAAILQTMHVPAVIGMVGAVDSSSRQIRLNGSKDHPKVDLLIKHLRKRRSGVAPLRFKVHNPHPPRPFKADGKTCGPGTIPVSRKAYTRKGKGGRRIRVGAAKFCIVDQGTPGKASFGAKGPGALRPGTKPLIKRKGSLGDGFLKSMTDKQREAAIRRALKHSSYASVMGKLVVLALSSEIRKKYGAKLERAKAYLRSLKAKAEKKRAPKKRPAKKRAAKKTAKKKTGRASSKPKAKKKSAKKPTKKRLSSREQSRILDQYLAGKGC